MASFAAQTFHWLIMHPTFLARQQDSGSQENHNELYNYASVKFLVANRVNVFAIYLLVINWELFLHNLK